MNGNEQRRAAAEAGGHDAGGEPAVLVNHFSADPMQPL